MNVTEKSKNGLNQYFNPLTGKFGFTENELFVHMNRILMWLEEHKDYALIFMDEKEYNETILCNSSEKADFKEWYGEDCNKLLIIMIGYDNF